MYWSRVAAKKNDAFFLRFLTGILALRYIFFLDRLAKKGTTNHKDNNDTEKNARKESYRQRQRQQQRTNTMAVFFQNLSDDLHLYDDDCSRDPLDAVPESPFVNNATQSTDTTTTTTGVASTNTRTSAASSIDDPRGGEEAAVIRERRRRRRQARRAKRAKRRPTKHGKSRPAAFAKMCLALETHANRCEADGTAFQLDPDSLLKIIHHQSGSKAHHRVHAKNPCEAQDPLNHLLVHSTICGAGKDATPFRPDTACLALRVWPEMTLKPILDELANLRKAFATPLPTEPVTVRAQVQQQAQETLASLTAPPHQTQTRFPPPRPLY
jgi:hypothetical protein